MPLAMKGIHMNRLVHFEYFTQDPERTATFYEQVLGWRSERWGDQPYWLVTTGSDDQPGINGGIGPQTFPTDQRVINTVDVDDVDAVVERAKAAGGSVLVEKMPVPGVGWLAYLTDPDGIVFGVMQADEGARE